MTKSLKLLISQTNYYHVNITPLTNYCHINTTPMTVIKLLLSSILNLWQSLFLRLPYRSWDERCYV